MGDPITISVEDYERVIQLTQEAQNTPAILIVSGSTRSSPADNAWDRVRECMDELGKKYGYDPKTHGINSKREVVLP